MEFLLVGFVKWKERERGMRRLAFAEVTRLRGSCGICPHVMRDTKNESRRQVNECIMRLLCCFVVYSIVGCLPDSPEPLSPAGSDTTSPSPFSPACFSCPCFHHLQRLLFICIHLVQVGVPRVVQVRPHLLHRVRVLYSLGRWLRAL